MGDYSLWISALALIVSTLALFHGVYISRKQSKMERLAKQSELMTKLAHLEIAYSEEVMLLKELLTTASSLEMDESRPDAFRMLEGQVEAFSEFREFTREHRQWLSDNGSVCHETLLGVEHRVDSLRERVRSENLRLKELKAEIEEFIAKAVSRRPNKAKQSGMH